MAPRRSSHLVVLFSLAVLIALWVPSSAQSSSATGCLTTLVNLYPCLSFVNGTSAAPSSSCCSALGGVIQSNPQCLCSLIDGGSFPGVTINKTLALALPAACSLSTTSASQCNGTNSTPPSNSPPGAGGSPPAGVSPPAGGQPSPPTPSGSGSPPPPPRSSAAARGGFETAGVLFTGVLLSLGGIGIGFN